MANRRAKADEWAIRAIVMNFVGFVPGWLNPTRYLPKIVDVNKPTESRRFLRSYDYGGRKGGCECVSIRRRRSLLIL